MQNAALLFLALGLVAVQTLIGGARLVDALPGYLFVAVAGLAVFAARKTPRVLPSFYCLASTFAFAGYVLVRAWFSPVAALARPDAFLALAALVAYLVAAVSLGSTLRRLAVTLILVLAGLAHVAVAVAQFREQQNFMLLPWIFRPDYGFRGSGLYISPNHLAALLGMLGVLTLSICCWSRVALPTRAFAFYGFMACLTGIALTGSRGGYVSTTVGLFSFALLSVVLARRFNRPNFFGLALATAFGLIAVTATAMLFVVRGEVYEKRLRHVHDPSRQAELLTAAALQQHRLSPLFGTGSGTFLYYGRQFHGPEVQNDPQHAHNEYLELLAEYGWTGAALFAVFWFSHFASAVRGLRRILEQKLKPTAWTASNELALLLGAGCALCIGLVQAGRDFTFHLPGNALLAAFLFAILANPTVEIAARRERRALPLWLGLAAPVLAMILLGAAVPRLGAELRGERARLALRDGDFATALTEARQALGRERANADLHYYAGEALRSLALETSDPARRGELRAEAAADFERGLMIFPHDLRLLLKLGQTCDDLQQPERADECFRRALEAAPNFGLVHAWCGVHAHRQRRLAEARRFYLRAQQLGETEVSTTGLGDLAHDEAVARGSDAFADLLPDRVEESPPPVK